MGKYDYLIGNKATTTPTVGGKYSYLIKAKKPEKKKEIKPLKPPRKGILGGLQTLYRDIKEVVRAPFPKQSFNPLEALKTGYQTVRETISDSARRNLEAISKVRDPKVSTLKKATAVGEAGMGVLNAVFLPITAPLQGAAKLPVVGSVAEVVNRLFGVLGVVGSDALEGYVEALPVSDKTKATITPLAKEVGALAAQVVAGKAGASKISALKQKSRELAVEIDRGVIETGIVAPEAIKTLPKVPEPVAPKLAVPKELEPLAQQARKYKSADEFVRDDFQKRVMSGQDLGGEIGKKVNPDGTLTIFHGTSKLAAEQINRTGVLNEGAFFSPKKVGTEFGDSPLDVAKRKFGKDGIVVELKVDARGLETAAAGSEIFSPSKLVKGSDGIWRAENIKEPSQLTDFYNKVTEAPKTVPNTRAITLEKAAVEKKLTDSLGTLPTHERLNMADQANRAVDFIERSPDQAIKIVRGEAIPEGILPEALYTAMEIKAIKTGDVATLKELANSTIPTTAGQALKALDSLDPNSPVRIMREIQQFREAKLQKKTGKQKIQATKDVVLEIKREVQKSVSKRPTWEEFIQEITCK